MCRRVSPQLTALRASTAAAASADTAASAPAAVAADPVALQAELDSYRMVADELETQLTQTSEDVHRLQQVCARQEQQVCDMCVV